MYAQESAENQKHPQGMQSFERGGYNIPANYKGNAFTLDEAPDIRACEDTEYEPMEQARECDICERDTDAASPRCPTETRRQDDCCEPVKKRERGLLSGIFDRFSRGFELDDILLIGLIVLLLQNDCERRDETVILLALLLLGGF